jgi:hypothetical protein
MNYHVQTALIHMISAYERLLPRVYAAWTAFWYPGVSLIPNTSVGYARVYSHGSVYGVYVELDVPSWESGSAVEVVLKDALGSASCLSPPPLPGLRLRLTPAALGAVGALRLDPLEDDTVEFGEYAVLP